MNEAHYLLVVLILFVLWSMNLIRLVPLSKKKAEKELLRTVLRDTNQGIFK